MQVLQTNLFRKAVKKLHKNQKRSLDRTLQKIISDPALGESNTGDLSIVRVYKFKMVNQLTLLGYIYDNNNQIILLAFGTHENFYRDLKKSK